MRQIDADALKVRFIPEQCYFTEAILNKIDTAPTIEPQAARLMTLEETDNAEVAWLEEYADPADGVEPIIQPVIIVWHENGCWHCLIDRNEDAGLDLFIDGLWTEWRFWTQRPTDEQRKAVPWNGAV